MPYLTQYSTRWCQHQFTRYSGKVDGSGQLHLGFIAEDTPPLIQTQDKKGIVPDNVLAILTTVVKEHQKEIHDLEKKLARLGQVPITFIRYEFF